MYVVGYPNNKHTPLPKHTHTQPQQVIFNNAGASTQTRSLLEVSLSPSHTFTHIHASKISTKSCNYDSSASSSFRNRRSIPNCHFSCLWQRLRLIGWLIGLMVQVFMSYIYTMDCQAQTHRGHWLLHGYIILVQNICPQIPQKSVTVSHTNLE